jgi:outer membrane protein assembly factor BamB
MPRPGVVTLALVLCLAAGLSANDWPQWRGARGNGITTETGLPVTWSEQSGIAWRAKLAGAGVSTPIVFGSHVYVTSQVGAGVRRPGNHPALVQGADAASSGERNLTGAAGDRVRFVLAAYRWSDGGLAWQREIPAEGTLTGVHDKHNLATPSPVANADGVIAWFGTGQVIAVDHQGRPRWTKHLARDYAPFEIQWGHASSPALYRDLALFVVYHEPASYVLALDASTGAVRWKADRGAKRLSYSTPIVVDSPAGAELIVNGSDGLEAMSVETGKTRWRVLEDNRFPIPVATIAGDMLFTTRGYRSGPFVAIRLGGRGDVTASHVAWRVPTGAPYVSSLILYDGLIFTASELGIFTCLDAKTGERVWQERVGGVFTASPVAGDGKIYFVSETGETVVVRPGRTAQVIARNRLDAHFVASPAISRGKLFLRADDQVIAVGAAGSTAPVTLPPSRP